jgi:hypothetical protein
MKKQMMICPKTKGCHDKKKWDCDHSEKHTHNIGCDRSAVSCPKCVPIKPNPKSIFSGLRKGDRIEVDALGTIMVYYVNVDNLRLWYKTNSESKNIFCMYKDNVKSIRKLAVKK